MAFIPGPKVAMVTVNATIDEQELQNTLYFRLNAPAPSWPQVSLELLVKEVRDYWASAWQPTASDRITFRGVEASDLTSADGITAAIDWGLPATGGQSLALLPNNCSLAVSFRTARRGRSYRGRNYIVGIPENQVVSNEVDGAWAEAARAFYEGILTQDWTAPGDLCTWGVFSRYANGDPRPVGVFEPITSVTLTNLVIDSQRNRLPGRGK